MCTKVLLKKKKRSEFIYSNDIMECEHSACDAGVQTLHFQEF